MYIYINIYICCHFKRETESFSFVCLFMKKQTEVIRLQIDLKDKTIIRLQID